MVAKWWWLMILFVFNFLLFWSVTIYIMNEEWNATTTIYLCSIWHTCNSLLPDWSTLDLALVSKGNSWDTQVTIFYINKSFRLKSYWCWLILQVILPVHTCIHLKYVTCILNYTLKMHYPWTSTSSIPKDGSPSVIFQCLTM